MFSCDFYEFFKNTLFIERLRWPFLSRRKGTLHNLFLRKIYVYFQWISNEKTPPRKVNIFMFIF